MALKTRTFDCAEASYFNVASFLAVTTFPNSEEQERKFRDQLRIACLRHASLQARSPAIIEVPLEVFQTEVDQHFFSEALEVLYRRFGLGFIVIRQSGLWDDKDYSAATTSLLDAFVDALGHSSVTTAFTTEWKPAWPVLHAAASVAHAGILGKYGIANLNTETMTFSDYSISEFKELIFGLMMCSGEDYALVAYADEVRNRILERQLYKKVREPDLIEFKIADPHLSQQDRPWWKGENWKITSRMNF